MVEEIYSSFFPSNHLIHHLSKKHNIDYQDAIVKIHNILHNNSELNALGSKIFSEKWDNNNTDNILYQYKKALFFRYEWVDKFFEQQNSFNSSPPSQDNSIKLYHYTSWESCEKILKSKNLLLRNNGFNDPNESIPRNIFVASFSLLEDHPTLFRLYGDNTMGVCMEFELSMSKDKDLARRFPFLMLYDEGKINSRMAQLQQNILKTTSIDLLNPKYTIFQKSIAYQDEHEIRIAYSDENTQSGESVIPVGLSQLGLKPTRLILGSNCSSKENSEESNNLEISSVEVSKFKFTVKNK
ncbi:MAG: DUF2971 domain-containing protein [Brevinema sp.]